MAGTFEHSTGIMSWVLSIRSSLANDLGRRMLEEEIQVEGFSFLEKYLEDILAGSKDGPVIELMKTPGRTKNRPQTRAVISAAAARTETIVSTSLEGTDEEKENELPHKPEESLLANDKFHRSLLYSRADDLDYEHDYTPPSPIKESQDRLQLRSLRFNDVANIQKNVIVSDRSNSSNSASREQLDFTNEVSTHVDKELLKSAHHSTKPTDLSLSDALSAPVRSTTSKELSVIIEDDETEHSRKSIEAGPLSCSIISDSNASMPIFHSNVEGEVKTLQPLRLQHDQDGSFIQNEARRSSQKLMSSFSSSTFESILLDSPSMNPPPSLKSVESSPRIDQTSITPLAKQTSHMSPEKATSKADPPQFPVIGVPSPLRKSVRVHHEMSTTNSTKGTSTARSSWLIKAREAKAQEETTRKLHTFDSEDGLYLVATGLKRKSGEMLENDEYSYFMDNEHKAKVHRPNDDVRSNQDVQIQYATSSNNDTETLPSGVEAGADEVVVGSGEDPEGMIGRLKKTVEGISAKVGKSMGRSLGGGAATALAEARAAAEAKVAERNANEGRKPTVTIDNPSSEEPRLIDGTSEDDLSSQKAVDKRLSVSDLITTFEAKRTGQMSEKSPQQPVFRHPRGKENDANISVSRIPLVSPVKPRPQVFSAPQPKSTVFHAPTSQQISADISLKPHTTNRPLTGQSTFSSTQSSTYSDALFENGSWLRQTQETEYTDVSGSQPIADKEAYVDGELDVDMEMDDSWRMDGQIVIDQLWVPAIDQEDDSTWSTNPTKSQRVDTGTNLHEAHNEVQEPTSNKREVLKPEIEVFEIDLTTSKIPKSNETKLQSYSAVSLVEPQLEQIPTRSNSQASSSTSQFGFIGTATKLMSSVLGGGKKSKAEPVKSIQLAAAVAKKQQEEKDKKATRLKDMESRRQQALQKKAEGEKAREDRRVKEDNERKKRDKDDLTDKRPIKLTGRKGEEDTTKKRKLAVESQKKQETKKVLLAKEKKELGFSRIDKPASNNNDDSASGIITRSKDHAVVVQSTEATTVRLVGATVGAEANPAHSLSAKEKGKSKAPDGDVFYKQPLQIVQGQMQARVQSQLQIQVPVSTEHIELPDINSEYSDSDDEDRKRTFDLPDWAQSPEIREALQAQSRVNPDDVFGAIRPLRMEELFKARTSRFRARTSSANWAGSDRLTIAEQLEYNQRMGFES